MSRKGWKQELKMREIAQLCESTIRQALISKELPFGDKVYIATTLYAKFVPRDINMTGGSGVKIIIERPSIGNSDRIRVAEHTAVETA